MSLNTLRTGRGLRSVLTAIFGGAILARIALWQKGGGRKNV